MARVKTAMITRKKHKKVLITGIVSSGKSTLINTLFDENASCHLALGNAYSMNVVGGTTMSIEELKKIGYNVSITHVDFMFGSADMQIVGTTHDGKEVVIFEKGNFVI